MTDTQSLLPPPTYEAAALPPGWQAFVDPETGKNYYVTPEGTTTWDAPLFQEPAEQQIPVPPQPVGGPHPQFGSYPAAQVGGQYHQQPSSAGGYPGASHSHTGMHSYPCHRVHKLAPAMLLTLCATSVFSVGGFPGAQPQQGIPVPQGQSVYHQYTETRIIHSEVDDPRCAQCGTVAAVVFPIAGCCTYCVNQDAPIGSQRRAWAMRAAIVGFVTFAIYNLLVFNRRVYDY